MSGELLGLKMDLLNGEEGEGTRKGLRGQGRGRESSSDTDIPVSHPQFPSQHESARRGRRRAGETSSGALVRLTWSRRTSRPGTRNCFQVPLWASTGQIAALEKKGRGQQGSDPPRMQGLEG